MAHEILVVVDVQNDFVTGSLGSKYAQVAKDNIIDLLKSNKFDLIVSTYDTHLDNYINTKEGQKLPVEHCVYNTNGWFQNPEVYEAIANSSYSEKIRIIKPTFGSIELVEKIKDYICNKRNYGVENFNITFVGLCTDICVISNVLMIQSIYGQDKNIDVRVIENCCAGVTPEFHKSAIDVMKSCQITIK